MALNGMLDLSADGSWSTNAIYQQLENEISSQLSTTCLEPQISFKIQIMPPPNLSPPSKLAKNPIRVSPRAFDLYGEWPPGDYVCVHDEHDMHIL